MGILIRRLPRLDPLRSRSSSSKALVGSRELRHIADEQAAQFALRRLTRVLRDRCSGARRRVLRRARHATSGSCGSGTEMLLSAELGTDNSGHRLRAAQPAAPGGAGGADRHRAAVDYCFTIPPRDEAGLRALADLTGRAINLVANALAQSADHVLSFFTMLRVELGFYVGCLNLHERLTAKGEPVCIPRPGRGGPLAAVLRGPVRRQPGPAIADAGRRQRRQRRRQVAGDDHRRQPGR